MKEPEQVSRAIRYGAVGLALVAVWAFAAVQSGFGIVQIAVFAGPGLVLAVAASWMAHIFSSADWTWDNALNAGVAGALIFPPVVAFIVAWGATMDSSMTIFIFVFGSWFALAVGLVAGVGGLARRRHRAAKARDVHLTMLD